MAQQLLTRYGVVFRETAHAENLPGGFSAIYDVLKAMEESGKIRRGYFAADLGATQFAMPAAVDLLRSLRVQQEAETRGDAAAGGYRSGESLWSVDAVACGAGCGVVADAECGGEGDSCAMARWWLICGEGIRMCRCFCRRRSRSGRRWRGALAEFLVGRVQGERGEDDAGRAGMLIATVNGVAVAESAMARALLDAGFAAGAMGFNVRRNLPPLPGQRSGVSANA